MHVNAILERAAARFGSATAITDGTASLSYRDLHDTVARYAGRLRERGLGRGDVVAVRIDRSLDTVPIFLATQWIGAAYLPVDDRLPAARVRFMLTDAGCDCLIVEDDLPDAAAFAPTGVHLLTRSALPGAPAAQRPELGETAYILYTSGSTGLPKAVPISVDNLAFFAEWLRRTYTAEEMAYAAFTISVGFDVSFAEILAPLIHGGTLVIYEDLFAIEGTSVPLTAVANVPGNFSRYLRRGALPATLKVVTSLGEALIADLARRLMAGGARLINAYGPTETTIYTTHHVVDPADLDTTAIPIGRPLDGVTGAVLRADGSACADGEPGELVITGPNVSRGYLSAHARDSTAFTPGDAWPAYRTGDIVVRDASGVLTYLGRADRQCKVNGIRVDLQEVTAALLGCAGVASAHVCARETPAGTRLIAFVTPEPGGAPHAGDIQAKLITVLPRYCVPHNVFVVAELPTTLSGKIDEAALLSGAETGTTDPVAELLALCTGSASGTGRAEGFLHALSSLELIGLRHRLLREFATDVPLRLIYRCRTVDELTELVKRSFGNARPGAQRECGIGEQNIWLADMYRPEACVNNELFRLTFREPVAAERIEAALRRCVRDFPALRTAYRFRQGKLVKEVAGPADVDLPLEIARDEPDATFARRPFDLASPLKLRARYLPGETPVVLLCVHHIAIDAVAVDVLLEHLEAVLLQAPVTLPQASDVDWSGTAGQPDLDRFWRTRLAALEAGSAPTSTCDRAERRAVTLSGQGLESARRAALAARTSLFGVVHAALTTVLGHRLGTAAVSIGTPVTTRAETDRRVGCLTNVIPLVAAPRAGRDPASYLDSLRADMLESFDHAAIALSDLRSILASDGVPLMHSLLAEVRKPGRRVRLFDADEVFTGVPKMPLVFLFEDTGDALTLVCEYTPDVDTAGGIDALLTDVVKEMSTRMGVGDDRVASHRN